MSVAPFAFDSDVILKVEIQLLGSRGREVGPPTTVIVDARDPEERKLWDFSDDQ